MAVEIAPFRETLIVLATAGVVIPLFRRLRITPVIGFILAGLLIGPVTSIFLSGHAPWLADLVAPDGAVIAPTAELGVALLMFMIGLELSFERLKTMRRVVFGLGGLQVLTSAAAVGLVAYFLLGDVMAAVALGLAFSVSSTAIIIQTLSERRRLEESVGKLSFSVLLFQDLAVVPILFTIGVLGSQEGTPALPAALLALGQAGLSIVAIVFLGRLVLRPLFRLVAGANSPESFVAASLLVILGASFAAAAAGLSMAMGALVAGILLAETEYRRQIEVTIEPFKGLLLGVFLISIGLSVDLARIIAMPWQFLLAAVALVLVKTAIFIPVARLFGIPLGVSLQSGAMLGPGSEFSFVILAAALAGGLIGSSEASFAVALAAVTMASIPFIERGARILADRFAPAPPPDLPILPAALEEETPRVIIAGFGRVGHTVAAMLEKHKIPYLAIDADANCVAHERRGGRPIAYGDATNLELLRRCGIDRARGLVVTLDTPRLAANVVEAARGLRSDLVIVARARDETAAAHLYRLGATDAVPETTEAALVLCEQLLVDLGVPMGYVIASVHEKRAEQRGQIQEMAPDAEVRRPRLIRETHPDPE